jgi:hypothetical protein
MPGPKDRWSRWHPIARDIAQKLVQRDEPDLTADELVEIKDSLKKIFDQGALEGAVRDILLLAAALEHEGQAHLAEKLFSIVEAKPVIGALDRINHVRAIDRAEVLTSNGRRFAQFSKHESAACKAPGRSDSPARGLRVRDLLPFPIAG